MCADKLSYNADFTGLSVLLPFPFASFCIFVIPSLWLLSIDHHSNCLYVFINLLLSSVHPLFARWSASIIPLNSPFRYRYIYLYRSVSFTPFNSLSLFCLSFSFSFNSTSLHLSACLYYSVSLSPLNLSPLHLFVFIDLSVSLHLCWLGL